MGGTLAPALAPAGLDPFMNKILSLFDPEFVKQLFQAEILPLYPEFSDIERVEVRPYKKNVWSETYHVVIRFNVYFSRPGIQAEKHHIICTAHSDEPRENAFQALNYLWSKGFVQAPIGLPRPLFYSDHFRGLFYESLAGESLLHYIKQADKEALRRIITKSAILFAKLHQLPAGPEADFNPGNARLATVVPGREKTLKEMHRRYDGRYNQDFEAVYNRLNAVEEKFFSSSATRCLIHGDAHSENIIETVSGGIGMIDFTDMCLADFARDIGSFLQQLDYRIEARMGEPRLSEELRESFLKTYFDVSSFVWSPDVKERINLYQFWAMFRTAIFLFLKHESDPAEASRLLGLIKNGLGI